MVRAENSGVGEVADAEGVGESLERGAEGVVPAAVVVARGAGAGRRGVGTAVGQADPKARVFAGGQYSSSTERSRFLLLRMFLSSV